MKMSYWVCAGVFGRQGISVSLLRACLCEPHTLPMMRKRNTFTREQSVTNLKGSVCVCVFAFMCMVLQLSSAKGMCDGGQQHIVWWYHSSIRSRSRHKFARAPSTAVKAHGYEWMVKFYRPVLETPWPIPNALLFSRHEVRDITWRVRMLHCWWATSGTIVFMALRRLGHGIARNLEMNFLCWSQGKAMETQTYCPSLPHSLEKRKRGPSPPDSCG